MRKLQTRRKDTPWRRVCIHGHLWSHSTQLHKSKCLCILEEVDLTMKGPDLILHQFHCYPPDVPFILAELT